MIGEYRALRSATGALPNMKNKFFMYDPANF